MSRAMVLIRAACVGLLAACIVPTGWVAGESQTLSAAGSAVTASRWVDVRSDRALFIELDHRRQRWGLWVTDGTPDGTRLLRMLPKGREPRVRWVGEAGGRTLLGIDDGRHGTELWSSDGTRSGTRLLLDVRPGETGSEPVGLTSVDDRMVFRANDGVHGAELWSTDGTARGTRRISDIRPGRNTGWRTWPSTAVELTGRSLFLVDDGVHGEEPWITDGTMAGTHLLVDLQPGPPGSEVEMLGAAPSVGMDEGMAATRRALFVAPDAAAVARLWASDGTPAGTGTIELPGPVADLETVVRCGSDLSEPGIAIMAATDRGTAGVWRTDGTIDGTAYLGDIPARLDREAQSVTCQTDAAGQTILHDFEDRDGPSLVLPVEGGRVRRLSGADPGPAPTSISGVTYLAADDGIHGPALWRTDGTESGTWMVKDIAADDQPPFEDAVFGHDGFAALGRGILFPADDGVHGYELWVSDGTEAGTRLLADLAPGAASPFVLSDDDGSAIVDASLVPVGGRILFRSNDGVHGPTMWTTDGTPSGTRPLRDATAAQGPMPPALVVDPSPARAGDPWHRMDGPIDADEQDSGRWFDPVATAEGAGQIVVLGAGSESGASQLWGSPDGSTWTESDLPARFAGRLTDLVSTADGFLAIGAGTTLWSSDGRAWTERSSLAGVDLHVVAAAGDHLVAGGWVGTDGRSRAAIWTSSDAGSTWERTSFAEGLAIEEIAASTDGTVLALILDSGIGDPDLHTELWSFKDGRSDLIDLPGRVGYVTGVSWNEHGFFVTTARPARHDSLRATVWRSQDARTWTRVMSTPGAGTAVHAPGDCILWFGSGGTGSQQEDPGWVALSDDGATWRLDRFWNGSTVTDAIAVDGRVLATGQIDEQQTTYGALWVAEPSCDPVPPTDDRSTEPDPPPSTGPLDPPR